MSPSSPPPSDSRNNFPSSSDKLKQLQPEQQSSRQGKAAITIFVKPEHKAVIRAALADGGYGTSYQAGIVNLLNELLNKQNRHPLL